MRKILLTMVAPAALGLPVLFSSCGGGGGGGDRSTRGPLSVRSFQPLPNGPQLPPDPSPPTQNQFFRVEFTTPLNPATLLDANSPNGLTSQVRVTTTYWTDSQRRGLVITRTPGRPLVGGVDAANRAWTNEELRIDPNTPIRGQNVLIFVADRDGDPTTIESFLPEALVPQNPPSGAPREAQLQVIVETGVQSPAGRALATSFGTAFTVGPDSINPTVVSSVPPPDSTNVPISTDIVINLSEPIDVNSVVPGAQPTGTFDVSVLSGPNVLPATGTVSVASSQNSCSILFRPAQALPGRTLVQVTLVGGSGSGTGIRDLVGNRLINPNPTAPDPTLYVFTFRTGEGPELSNNPVTPEAIYFATQSPTGIGVVEANYSDQREDIVFPQTERGTLVRELSDTPADILVGTWLVTQTANAIGNPPRHLGNAREGNPPCTTPGQWCAPGFTCPSSPPSPLLCSGLCPELTVPPLLPPPRQPLGNFLFVSNPRADVVHVLNSNTFQIIMDIPTPEPSGLGMTPTLEGSSISHFLFVANFDAGTVSVIDIARDQNGNPRGGPPLRRVAVGNGPRGLAVESQNEDAFVCNSISNTVSIIRISNLGRLTENPVRKTLSGSVGPTPWDVSTSYRLNLLPFLPQPLLTYYAFITNRDGNSVSIYEAGPPLANGYGRDGVVDVIQGFNRPMGISDDYTSSNPQTISPARNITGCWVANNGDGKVIHLAATDFRNVLLPLPNPPPGWAVAYWSKIQEFPVGTGPVDVTPNDPFYLCDTTRYKPLAQTPGGAPLPTRLYVSDPGEGRIKAVQISNGLIRAEMVAPGPGKIAGFYKQ